MASRVAYEGCVSSCSDRTVSDVLALSIDCSADERHDLQSVARITTRSIAARRVRWKHMCLRQQHGTQSVIPANHGK